VKGRIDAASWRIDPSRRFFFILLTGGAISSIDAECDTRRVELQFNPDDNYGLPESFGACTIFVNGDAGTTFSFVEALPSEE
jgi:hypothetical protein